LSPYIEARGVDAGEALRRRLSERSEREERAAAAEAAAVARLEVALEDAEAGWCSLNLG